MQWGGDLVSSKMQTIDWPTRKDRLRVVVSGGGTGGHIYPALAIAAALHEQRAAEILYMGGTASPQGGPPKERELAVAAGWEYQGVSAVGLTRRFPRILHDLLVNDRGVGQAKEVLRRFAPQLVIGTGGYAMAPTLLAATALHIPALLHEQNAYPGWANRYLARRTDLLCLSWDAACSYFPARTRMRLTGLPVRPELLEVKNEATKEEARRFFGITEAERLTLLVTGGSQGAQRLNEAISGCYESLLEAGLRIIHLTGEANYENCRVAAAGLKQENLYILPYLNKMQYALALADLVAARAGASFLAEAALAGLPTILVPYPYAAGDHQTLNARSFVAAGAALLIADPQLTSITLSEAVLALLHDAEERQRMSEAARSLARPDALDRIVAAADELLNVRRTTFA